MLNGLLDLSVWGVIGFTLLFTHLTIASVTIYLHRHQAHRALDLHPAVALFMRTWLWLTTGMVTRDWVAIHRKHHAKCETPDDPHSPQVLGIRKVLLEGSELYRAEARNAETLEKYSHGTPTDWAERHIFQGRSRTGVGIMLIANVLLFGPIGITVWAVQMLWIPIFAAGVINGLGHWWGYRNYECADAATNISPWGILIGGEELHNNHHAFPSSARLSNKAWEFDIGWLYIRLLEMVGLARVKKVAPEPLIDVSKDGIDLDTVRAIIMNRMHVMAHYARDVLLPVHREAVNAAPSQDRGLLGKARGLVVRELSLLDEKAHATLDKALAGSKQLATVYQFRLRLQEVWSRSAASHDQLVQALQDWCRQAEATGIQVLQDFAQSLRGYSLRTA